MPARHKRGTRFRLFPEYFEGFLTPETIELSPPAGSLRPGPTDATMHVVDAVGKRPYDPPFTMPPYSGPRRAPALPNGQGDFDWIPLATHQFLAAHLYGSVRFTLDVWERYLGRRVVWWYADTYPQLELVPMLRWNNAQSGPGFLETGERPRPPGRPLPFCLIYEIVAHETGHTILFSQMGVPPADRLTGQFLAFHESFADLIGMLAALHFPSVPAHLLEQTGGDLYVYNLLNRIGETSAHSQIRLASNRTTLRDVAGLALAEDGTWIDPLGRGRNAHDLAQPLTGAIFDALVEIYQRSLVAEGLIRPPIDARGWSRAEVEASLVFLHGAASQAFDRFRRGFTEALLLARDVAGRCMAQVVATLDPGTLSFEAVAARFLEAAVELGQQAILPALLDVFLSRGIDPRPLLRTAPVPARGHRGRRRPDLVALRLARPHLACRHCDAAAVVLAHRLLPHAHRTRATPAGQAAE
jgi:hypothetical protein